MYTAILVFSLSLITKTIGLGTVSLACGFCRIYIFEPPPNTSNGCHKNQSVSLDEALDNLSEKLNSRVLVQEEFGFQKGEQYAP